MGAPVHSSPLRKVHGVCHARPFARVRERAIAGSADPRMARAGRGSGTPMVATLSIPEGLMAVAKDGRQRNPPARSQEERPLAIARVGIVRASAELAAIARGD